MLKQHLRTWFAMPLDSRMTFSAKCNQVWQLIGRFPVAVKVSIGLNMMNAKNGLFVFMFLSSTNYAFVAITSLCSSTLSVPVMAAYRCTTAPTRRVFSAHRNTFPGISAFIGTKMWISVWSILKRFLTNFTDTFFAWATFFLMWNTFQGTENLFACYFAGKATTTSRTISRFGMSFSFPDISTLERASALFCFPRDKLLITNGADFHSTLVNAISHVVGGQGGTSAARSLIRLDHADIIPERGLLCH